MRLEWLKVALIISLLPIWRYPPKEGGFNLWQLLRMRSEPRPHLPVEEAIRQYEEARLGSAAAFG